MQDIIKHKVQHTAGTCPACHIIRKDAEYKARRLRRKLNDISMARAACKHESTRSYVEPLYIDENGDYSSQVVTVMCRTCVTVVKVRE